MSTIQDTDTLLVNRGGTDYKVKAEDLYEYFYQPPLPPWEGARGIYHVIITDPAAINVTGKDKIYNKDTWDDVPSINAPGEYIITGRDTRFSGSIGNWDFGDLTDTSKVLNMGGMFDGAEKFNGKGLNYWDVSNVGGMGSMFKNAKAFNQDIGNWDVSNVTDMALMFWVARAFNSDISKWNVSKVGSMYKMFYAAGAFNSDISGWDVSNVQRMGEMFRDAKVFNSNISNWDVSNAWYMEFMFHHAEAFNQDISKWDTSNVMNMGDMFSHAKVFNQDLTGWCVSNFKNNEGQPQPATKFSWMSGMPADGSKDPKWGTCPRGEDQNP